MPNNKMTDLRNHLFATLEGLADAEKPMEIERAKAISEVAQTIINSAKVEIQYLETVGAEGGTDFFPLGPTEKRPLLPERSRAAVGR